MSLEPRFALVEPSKFSRWRVTALGSYTYGQFWMIGCNLSIPSNQTKGPAASEYASRFVHSRPKMNDTRDITRHRVIIHLDLDCFYAQVEGIRLQIPDNEPIAAHQWGFVLAVNYIARQYGVKRGDSIDEARKKCAKLHTVS